MQKKFRLQKVLEHRERLLDLSKNKLSELQMKQKDIEARIEVVTKEIRKQTEDKHKTAAEGKVAFLKMYDTYIAKLNVDLFNLRNMMAKATKEVEDQKKAVIEATNNLDIMKKLKNKHDINYTKYLDREEMKMIDDLVTTRRSFFDE